WRWNRAYYLDRMVRTWPKARYARIARNRPYRVGCRCDECLFNYGKTVTKAIASCLFSEDQRDAATVQALDAILSTTVSRPLISLTLAALPPQYLKQF